jgi:Uracil DNA glycosylase superfamily
MATFAEKVISFFGELEFSGLLPEGISIMNPYRDNPQILPLITRFYKRFYSDNNSRHLILGINPGRFGAGVTGLPFTDTKRLKEKCGLSVPDLDTFETSSVFIYNMIDVFGGVEKFYNTFFISAVSPLGFTSVNAGGKAVNYNYYDSKKLITAVYDFMVKSLIKQLEFGIEKNVCFCLGTGKNYDFISKLNNDLEIFKKIVPLEHPRYIMQYKSKLKLEYIKKYIDAFSEI